jgi:ATP-dependent helicase/nuclease subunit B
MDESLETGYSTVLPAAIKKDGSFYSSSSVADKNAFDVLRAYTRRMIQEVGQGITEGNISISPYRLNNRTPCEFCSYRPVCQFDQSKEGNQYRFLKKQKDNQVLEQMKEKEGGHAHDVKNGEA